MSRGHPRRHGPEVTYDHDEKADEHAGASRAHPRLDGAVDKHPDHDVTRLRLALNRVRRRPSKAFNRQAYYHTELARLVSSIVFEAR